MLAYASALDGVRENIVNVRKATTNECVVARFDPVLKNIEDMVESLLTEVEQAL